MNKVTKKQNLLHKASAIPFDTALLYYADIVNLISIE